MMPARVEQTKAGERSAPPVSTKLVAFLLISGCCVAAQPVCETAPSGLISWWPGQATTADIVGGINGGWLGQGSYTQGEVGQGFSFDGQAPDCVHIPYASSLGSPTYTVELWVAPLTAISDPTGQKVLFAQNRGRVQLIARPGSTGARVVFQFFVGPNSWQSIQSSADIPLNAFSHIAATWDGTTQRLYVNGIMSAQATPGVMPWDSGCDFFIGGISSTTGSTSCQYQGQFFQGLIDEVSYYRRALTGSEIQAIYNAGAAGKCPPNPAVVSVPTATPAPPSIAFDLERRDASGQPYLTRQVFQPRQLAIVVMDVWNSHPDPEMASRASALIPKLNQALDAARALGITVIFCPNEVPLPATANTSVFASLPNQALVDNGFNPQLPSYANAVSGDMVPIAYDLNFTPRFPIYTGQHVDLLIRPGDLASISRQQIANYCAAKGITHLLYVGVAANMCVCWSRETSMIPMKRYCNLEPILVRDLSDSMTLNGRRQTGVIDGANNLDLTMTPDRGHLKVVAQDETYVCSSIDARQLLQYWPAATYANLVTGESNLLCFWQMDSKADYQEILDTRRIQSCWWNRNDLAQTAGLDFNVAGALTNAGDTALKFNGSTILVSPLYRDDIPTNSPLVSLSSTNFTFEMWVQPASLNSNQWLFAHDNGLSNGADVLLGISSNNHFRLMVGTDAARTTFGDSLESATVIGPDDIASGRWYHLTAVHDVDHGSVSLFVDGILDAQTNHQCAPVSLSSAPHFGSRGLVRLGGSQFLLSLGFGFFHGALDECAIYSAALSADQIALHYRVAREPDPYPPPITALSMQHQLLVSWPAWPIGLRLQTSEDLSAWVDCPLPITEANGRCQISVQPTGARQFFRSTFP